MILLLASLIRIISMLKSELPTPAVMHCLNRFIVIITISKLIENEEWTIIFHHVQLNTR